jgi:hypothetical protein
VAVRAKLPARQVLVGEVVREPVQLPRPRHISSAPLRTIGAGVLYGLALIWRFIRTVLFFVLRTLRPFVRIALALVAGFCVLMTIAVVVLAWYRGWAESVLWQAGGFFLVAVICCALSWYYDVILLMLTPEGYQLALWS